MEGGNDTVLAFGESGWVWRCRSRQRRWWAGSTIGLGLVEDILLELIRVDAEHDGGLLACRGHRCFGGGPLDNESVVEVPDHCFN